jgi:hypothetical protein
LYGDLRGRHQGNTFEGEIKYQPAAYNDKPVPENAVDPGQKMTITFAPQAATVPAAADRDKSSDLVSLCGDRSGIFGRYTKDRKR